MEPTNIPSPINGPQKFTDTEQAEFAELKKQFNSNVQAFGQLYLQRKDLDQIEQELLSERESIRTKEKAFLDSILAKYGEGTFDQATGIFTPKK